jgi:hypothetical protein
MAEFLSWLELELKARREKAGVNTVCGLTEVEIDQVCIQHPFADSFKFSTDHIYFGSEEVLNLYQIRFCT